MAHARFTNRRYFGSLDGLRAISILAVILHHTASSVFAGTPLERIGGHGVHFFFAISGFLITSLLLRERERNGKIDLRAFYVRRSLRILPLYYSVLLLYALLVLVMEHGEDGRAFFHNVPFFATYTSNWFVGAEGRVIFYFAWSLATEEQFYLVWPSVEKRLPRLAPFLMALVVVFVSLVSAKVFPLDESGLTYRVIDSIPPALGIGVILAHALHRPRSFRVVWPVLGHRASAPLLAIALGAAIVLGLPGPVVYPLMATTVAACAIREDNGLARLLRLPAMRSIGVVSYGMYLFNVLASNAADRVLPDAMWARPAVLFTATTALTFGAAWVSFHHYESWFLRLKRRFVRLPTSRRPSDDSLVARPLLALPAPAPIEAHATSTPRSALRAVGTPGERPARMRDTNGTAGGTSRRS